MKHKPWNSTIGYVKNIAPLLALALISACTRRYGGTTPTAALSIAAGRSTSPIRRR